MANPLDMVAGVGQFGFDPLGDFVEGRKQRAQLDELKRADQTRALSGAALTGDQNSLRELAGVNPNAYVAVSKYQQTDPASEADKVASLINWADTPEKWTQATQRLQASGHQLAPEELDFNNRGAMLAEYTSLKDQIAMQPKDYTLNEGQQRRSGTDNSIIAQGPPKTFRPVAAANTLAKPDDVPMIADAIVSGNQPPDLKALYRLGGPVKAELQRRGYNLTQATEDWQAQTKLITSLNGPQQVRLRQATNFAYDSLPIIEDLAKQWQAGGYPLLNKARLLAAKQGALGAPAQAIATQLETQIADLTSELGTVYKGGNSSTDESLRLAGKNLQADWSQDTLLKNIDLVRKNLDIRKNSLNLAVAGVGENRYAPKDQQTGELPNSEVEAAFTDAKDAIAQGADPEAVKKELIDMGIDPAYIDQGLAE